MGHFLFVNHGIFAKTFVRVATGNCSLADKVSLGVQARWAYLWCLGPDVPHTTICATPHNNMVLFEQCAVFNRVNQRTIA